MLFPMPTQRLHLLSVKDHKSPHQTCLCRTSNASCDQVWTCSKCSASRNMMQHCTNTVSNSSSFGRNHYLWWYLIDFVAIIGKSSPEMDFSENDTNITYKQQDFNNYKDNDMTQPKKSNQSVVKKSALWGYLWRRKRLNLPQEILNNI